MTEGVEEGAGAASPRLTLVAFAATAGLMALARVTPPGPLLALLAVVSVAVPVAFVFRLAPVPRAALLAATTVGFRVAFDHLVDYEPWAFGGQLALELAYYAVPPFLLNLVAVLLGPRLSEHLALSPVHVYLPLLVVVPVVAGTLFYQDATGAERLGAPLRTVGIVYGLCYSAILAVVFATRTAPPETPTAPARSERASDLESTGRFGVAARYYAQDGNFAKAAEMAERAGEWEKAAVLHGRAGKLLEAGEMYSRAGRWEEAVDAYTRSGHHAAAALVCERQGGFERGAAAFEKAGDPAAAVRVLELGGGQVPPELYERAGLFAKAAAVHLARGGWQRAVEILEQNLGDVEGAAGVCLDAGAWVEAGRLFEKARRFDAAIDAYLKAPDSAFEALRLCLEQDQPDRARQIAAGLSPEAERKAAQDERTALILARLHQQAGRVDDAIRLLQRLKRDSAAGGAVYLMLGRCFREKGLTDLAEQELSTAVTLPLGPREELEARYELARVLETLGRPERALEIYRDIIQQEFDYRDAEQRYRQLSAPSKPA